MKNYFLVFLILAHTLVAASNYKDIRSEDINTKGELQSINDLGPFVYGIFGPGTIEVRDVANYYFSIPPYVVSKNPDINVVIDVNSGNETSAGIEAVMGYRIKMTGHRSYSLVFKRSLTYKIRFKCKVLMTKKTLNGDTDYYYKTVYTASKIVKVVASPLE